MVGCCSSCDVFAFNKLLYNVIHVRTSHMEEYQFSLLCKLIFFQSINHKCTEHIFYIFIAGPCQDRLPKWYFDNLEKRCMPFYYGGCEGKDIMLKQSN